MLDRYPLFDSHLHIIDPTYPLIPNKGYTPPYFTCDDYLHRVEKYNIVGGAIVSGSFQAFDQSYLIAALKRFGTDFVGVTQLPHSISDDAILELDQAGIKAVRFNLFRGGSETLPQLASMAARIFELAGWHVELYVDASNLDDLKTTITQLPSVSIDHLGLKKAGFRHLLSLAEKGVRVKATGFGRVDMAPLDAIQALYRANPHALIFGTDLPSTRADRPYLDTDFIDVVETMGPVAAKQIMSENALRFYGKQKPK